MGYDCTLHVIDEALIRDHFVPRLLGRSDEHRAFDEREDADTLWARVREALAGEGEYGKSPSATASLIAQLAVAYCASELPNHYERGLCLALWPDQPDGLHGKVPKRLVGDPAALFGAVIAARPDLKGRFPKDVTGNWSTGLYILAANVPELLAFVEKKVKRYPKPDRRLFRGLILVLKYAAERGLGYWEGTDLPVVGGQMRPPESERRPEVEEFRGPDRFYMDCRGEAPPTIVLAHAIGHPQRCQTAFADLSAWPPALTIVDEYALTARRSRGGRWVMVSTTTDTAPVYRVRLGGGATEEKQVLLPPDEREHGAWWADLLGERVVAVLMAERLPSEREQYLPAVPLLEEGGRLVPIEGLPTPSDDSRMAAAYGAAHLNDGTDVFLWMGIGYELREGRFQPAFDLGASRLCGEFTLPRGPDGFFHAGEYSKALWSSRRGEAPTRHLPKVEANIQWMSPGPQGSVLLKFGYSKRDGLGVLYFPEEEVYLRLEDELFPDEDPDDIRSLHWAGQCGRLIAVTPARLWAISIETVLALPRYNATTGRKLRS